MMVLVLIGVLLLLLALEFPVAIAMTGASVCYLLVRGAFHSWSWRNA
jgi:hypothetical protein